MRKYILWVVIIVMVFTLNLYTFPALAEQSDYVWVLVDVVDYDNADSWDVANESTVYQSDYSCSQGNMSVKKTYIDKTDDWYNPPMIQGEGVKISAVFSKPPERLFPDEEVSISVTVSAADNTLSFFTFNGSASADFDKPDLAPGSMSRSAIRFTDGDGEISFKVGAENNYSTISETLIATPPMGKEEGEQIALRQHFYMGISMGTYYIYEWQSGSSQDEASQSQETPTPEPEVDSEQQEIILHGGLHNVESKPMRNLSLDIEAFSHSDAEISEGATPFWSTKTISDTRRGQFNAKIPLPEEASNWVTIKVTGRLNCLLPDGSPMFYITDVQSELTEDEITFSTLIKLDLNSPEYKDQKQIKIDRLLNFRNLSTFGYLSIGVNDWQPDAFESNMDDLYALAAYSYHYVWAWNAQYVGAILFKELDALKDYPLKIEMRWERPDEAYPVDGSHYVPNHENIIRLTRNDSRFDDNSRFTLLHEYGHHLDCATIGGWALRTINAREPNTDHTSHGGYMNSSTSDSMMEGFATAYVAMVQSLDRKFKQPHIADIYDLGQSGNYVAWKHMGLDEELAVATLLYQTFLQYKTPLEFWQIMKPDYPEFIHYYQAFEKDLVAQPEALAILEDAARLGGLYHMPFGNGLYDFGEPYRDLNNNGQYDYGEPFGDLMFDVDKYMHIDPNLPLQEVEDDLVLGKSSDALRNRETVYQLPSSYVRFSGESISEVLVKVIPDDEPPTQTLRAVETDDLGQKVYIGLISRGLTGKVEISLPGGAVLYTGDLATLQKHRQENTIMDIPLAMVTIDQEVLDKGVVMGAPTYGDSNASGVFEILSDEELINQVADIAEFASQADPTVSLEFAFIDESNKSEESETEQDNQNEERESKEWPAFGVSSIFILFGVIILLIVVAVLIVILLVINKKRKPIATNSSQYNQKQNFIHQTPQVIPAQKSNYDTPVIQSAQKNQYCIHCGSKVKSEAVFCKTCGTLLKKQ